MTDQPLVAAETPPKNDEVWLMASMRPEVDAADVDIYFRRVPKAVPARHRVAYRTALAVLVLSRFNQSAAKLTNLHTLMWALRSTRTRRMFTAWWEGRRFLFTSTDRIDPDLQITLNLALVDGLIEPVTSGARVRLTDKGKALADLIDELGDLLAVEKTFLAGLDRMNDSAMERRLAGGSR